MSMEPLRNTIKEEVEAVVPEQAAHAKEASPATNSKGSRLKGILGGSFLAWEKVLAILPFLIFLTLLGMLSIYNSNYAEHTIIQINKTKKQIEEYRFNYINTKSQLLSASRQSELARRLASRGIYESKKPPLKIIVNENQ